MKSMDAPLQAKNLRRSYTPGRRPLRTGLPFFTQACLRVLFVCSLLAIFSSTYAITIVDTGTPVGGVLSVVTPKVAVAAEFDVINDSVITDIQGYLRVLVPGSLSIAVYSDGGDIPGAELFSISLPFGVASEDWHGASGLDWNVPSGTYWIAFQADATLAFGMRRPTPLSGSTPNPLGNEAVLTTDLLGYVWTADPEDDADFGVRIFGTETSTTVPETGSTLALSAIGLVAVAGLRMIRSARGGSAPPNTSVTMQ